MAFVVENGTGLNNATSYITVEEADAYHTLYATEAWIGETATKQLALIHASKACDLLFGDRYISYPVNDSQALLFPRLTFVINKKQVVTQGTLPKQLKDAICELALLHIQGIDIYPERNSANDSAEERVKVGDIEVQTKSNGSVAAPAYEGMWKIEMLLKPILHKSGVMNNPTFVGF